MSEQTCTSCGQPLSQAPEPDPADPYRSRQPLPPATTSAVDPTAEAAAMRAAERRERADKIADRVLTGWSA